MIYRLITYLMSLILCAIGIFGVLFIVSGTSIRLGLAMAIIGFVSSFSLNFSLIEKK